MFEMFKDAFTLFLKGKLFQDYHAVFRQVAIGAGITALTCMVLSIMGLAMWLAIFLAAFIGGALQPYLFKDLKYE
ncbi:hypothetical protein [Methyloglobulus sp.]|uniref:hypothetical protein n=1 Tax=Methyloglobulus sp. TaxID=2518622 RepID=UPI003988AD97